MNQQATVSIIVPCYNASRWLTSCLESALNQNWPDKEVIVVDDGSRDDSLAIARAFEPRGVRVVTQSNQGASAARNHGLTIARGRYIQYLDADDLLAPDKISRQMDLAATRRDPLMLSGAWGRFTTDPAESVFTPMPTWRDISGIECQQLFRETHGMMHPAAWLCRRSLLDEAGPWDTRLTLDDDGEYFQRVMLRAGTIHFCATARSFYRSNITGGSLSGRRDPHALGSLFKSCQMRSAALLAADSSPRTRRAVAQAWKQTAYEVYPECPHLANAAERESRLLGGGSGPIIASGRVRIPGKYIGWRLAKRLFGR